MDINKVLDEIGHFGWYQFIVSLLLASSMIPACFSNLNIVFIMGVTDFWCDTPELQSLNNSQEEIRNVTVPLQIGADGVTTEYSQCLVYDRNYTGWTSNDLYMYRIQDNVDNASTISCKDGWVYDTLLYGETATTQWDLVCDRKWWQAAGASFYSFGLFAALFVYGTLADLFGRKPLLCVGTILFIVSNFATAMSPNYIFFTVTRFLCGFFSSPFYGGTFVLSAELIGPKWRAHVNAWFGYFWSVGGIFMAGLAYFIRDWRVLQYTLSGIMLIFLVYLILPESPRWLYLKGKQEEADKIFDRIARCNNRNFTPGKLLSTTQPEERGFIWDLFRGKSLATRTVVCFWNWFAASICYYGLTLNSTSLGSNEYISFIISMLVEVPGMIMCHVVALYIGRKWPLVISMALSGIFLLLTLLFQAGSVALITLVSLGKMLCTLAFNLLYIYTVELYPTVIRSVGASTGNFAARLGSILAPFMAQLSDYNSSIPMVIFGVCSLSAGLVAILLPETIGINLEDTVKHVNTQENTTTMDGLIDNKDKENNETLGL